MIDPLYSLALSMESNPGIYALLLGSGVSRIAGIPTGWEIVLYMENVLPLTHPGSRFFLWCFEWPTRWWEKFFPFPHYLEPGEVERRFGEWFEVECIARTMEPHLWKFEPGTATYLMTRKEVEP